MSQPLGYSISSELISAMSALNTEVTYSGPKTNEEGVVFISDAESMVGHSMEHMRASMDISNKIREELIELKLQLSQEFPSSRKYQKMISEIEKKL